MTLQTIYFVSIDTKELFDFTILYH